jgi:hypothetical protein
VAGPHTDMDDLNVTMVSVFEFLSKNENNKKIEKLKIRKLCAGEGGLLTI